MANSWVVPVLSLSVMFLFSAHLELFAEAQDVLCYEGFDDATGACGNLLGDGVSMEDCCHNQGYSFRQGPGAPCQACHAAKWSEWSQWGPCSVTCTEGVQRRSRKCHGSKAGSCTEGKREWEMRSCNLRDCCPVEGGWSAWSSWGACSVTCLKGTQTRKRTCTNPAPTCGGSCQGNSEERQPCDTRQICPTHGNWGNWGNWEACDATCSPEGAGPKPRQHRHRLCNNPSPSTNPPGNPCPGSNQDSRYCVGLPYCPQDGNWGAWQPSSACSATCGVGRVIEKRQCDNPVPKHGGRNCLGENTRSHTCATRVPCPVERQWTEWSPWDTCVRFGLGKIQCQEISGLHKRNRTCLGKSSSGKRCDGKAIETRNCYNIHHCSLKGSWSDWSPWGLCEPPCGPNPMKTRKRECKPQYPDYPMMIEGVNGVMQDVFFWGTPLPLCQPLDGQKLKVEEQKPCLNVPPCQD